jgi:hypothetical protein
VAEAAPGWLIPEDAGATADQRAFHLLGGFLDDDQKETAERAGGFTHRVGDRLYWIPIEGAPRCAVLSEGRIEHLCIAPKRGEAMPQGDVALTYLLWLKADPDGFLAEANVLRTESFDTDLELDEVQARLAGPRRKTTHRRRRHTRTPSNRPGIALGNSLGDPLGADRLRGLLQERGVEVSDALLAKLLP